MNEGNKGITLVALVVTIVLMLILVGVTVSTAINGGLFGTAKEATFKTELAELKEELEAYKVTKKIETRGRFEESSLSANKYWLYYDPEGYVDDQDIEKVMPSISKEMKEKIEVLNGEIIFSGSEKEIGWAKEIGINKTVKIENGVLLSDNDNLSIVSEDGTFTVPSTVTTIGEGAFAKTNVRKVVIPYTVKEIEKNAFYGNTMIEEVEFQTKEIDGKEQGVEIIGGSAFNSCTNLREMILPVTLKKIGGQVFWACTSLTSIEFLSENIELGAYNFVSCYSLSSVKLPKNLTNIPIQMFVNCNKLKTIEIPTTVTKIETQAFMSCSALSELKIPASVTSIAGDAFRGCTALKNIEIDDENQTYAMKDGILMNKAGTNMIFMLEGASAIEESTFTVPQGVTTLPGGFLGNFNQITKVKIPSSVNYIDTGFFTKNITEIEINSGNNSYKVDNGMILNKAGTTLVYYYANEAIVNVPEGVTTIATGALTYGTGGSNVTEVNLPESLTTINSQSIKCPKLTKISIGKKVSSIDPFAFYNSGVKEIIIDQYNNNYLFEGGALYNKSKTKLVRVFDETAEFDVPEGVTEIGDQAFHYNSGTTKVKIPDTVTKIGYSFNSCSNLTEIEIPSSVEEISAACFGGCSRLTKIKIDKEKDSIPGAPWGATIGARAVEWLR